MNKLVAFIDMGKEFPDPGPQEVPPLKDPAESPLPTELPYHPDSPTPKPQPEIPTPKEPPESTPPESIS